MVKVDVPSSQNCGMAIYKSHSHTMRPINAVAKLDRTSMKKLTSTCAIHRQIQVRVFFRVATLCEKMNIDVPTLTQGVAVTKDRVAQRLRHLEKTRDQKAQTNGKTKLFRNFGRN